MVNIEIGIRAKQVSGGRAHLTIAGGLVSTMGQLSNDELLHLLHSLSVSGYAEATETTMGFPYTFPLVFGT
jgi:hypothetical protein